LDSPRKDTKRRERKPATLHFLRRLYHGYPLGHPELHGYWDRIAATLQDRIDYLTWAGRDDVTEAAAILNETAQLLLITRLVDGGLAHEQYDKAIVAIHGMLGTRHDSEAEPDRATLTPKAKALLLKLRGALPTYDADEERYEPQPLAAGLLKLIEEGEFGGLRRHTEAARENLRRRHWGQPQPRNGQRDDDADRDLDGYAEGQALYREANERNGQVTTDLPGRLRTLAKRGRDRGDLPEDFLVVVKKHDRARHSHAPSTLTVDSVPGDSSLQSRSTLEEWAEQVGCAFVRVDAPREPFPGQR
jgi:hypothetical protein